jgi:ABC-type transport system involved in multi-copper enzyme maturation permease subunit
MHTARLVLKLQRFEVLVLTIAMIALTLVSLFVAGRLSAIPVELATCRDPSSCMALQEEFNQLRLQATPITLINVVLPVFAGLIVGVAIVAREIERGTATLPWAMSASRRTWFMRRIVILGGLLAALSALPWITSELLAGASNPGVDMAHSFREVETRGPIIVARVLVAFSLASLAGAVMGRVLPGFLLAVVSCAAVLFVLQLAGETWLQADAAPMPESVSVDDSFIHEIGYLLPDGRVVDWDTAWEELDDPNSNPTDAFPQRYIGVPAALAPEKRAREVVLLLASGVLAVILAAVVVDRRRPY